MTREDDVALADAQVIWDRDCRPPARMISARPPVLVVARGGDDDRSYSSSWGCCNMDFNQASPAEKLNMLFRQFHHMAICDRVDPGDIHRAFLCIPEYRAVLPPYMLPDEYRVAA